MSRKTRTKSKTRNNAKSRAKKATVSTVKSTDTEETVIPTVEPAIIKEEVAQPEPKEEIKIETPVEENQVIEQPDLGPRRSVVFIGSECYPFVKTGGLGDVMSALPKSLAKLNVDVKVILPRYLRQKNDPILVRTSGLCIQQRLPDSELAGCEYVKRWNHLL